MEVLTKTYDESSTQNIVSTISDKQFHCQKCDKSYGQQFNLNKHYNSSHEEVKYNCTECSYKATQKSVLQRHVVDVHEGLQSFYCDQCEYKAARNSNLQIHLQRMHNK